MTVLVMRLIPVFPWDMVNYLSGLCSIRFRDYLLASLLGTILTSFTYNLIGATIVSSHAGEMISELSVAIAAGMGLGKLGSVINPYPTHAEAIKRVAGLYNKTRLTPFVAGLIRKWLA